MGRTNYPGSKTLKKIKMAWYGINHRCNNPKRPAYKYYGAKGIKNEITIAELYYLWIRDHAHLMDCPSIDRIYSKQNYTLKNCRFIEMKENTPYRPDPIKKKYFQDNSEYMKVYRKNHFREYQAYQKAYREKHRHNLEV